MENEVNEGNNPIEKEEKYLDIIKQDLETRQLEIKIKKEIDIETLKVGDKQNERQFEAFKKRHDSKNKQDNFIRNIVYGGVLMVSIITIFGQYLIYKEKPIGMEILKITMSALLGFLGGWGIGKTHSNVDK